MNETVSSCKRPKALTGTAKSRICRRSASSCAPRAHGLQAAAILLGVDARVSSVERYQGLKKGDRVKVWYADAHRPTEYVLNLTFASTAVGDVRTGQWVLKKNVKEKDEPLLDPAVDDWVQV